MNWLILPLAFSFIPFMRPCASFHYRLELLQISPSDYRPLRVTLPIPAQATERIALLSLRIDHDNYITLVKAILRYVWAIAAKQKRRNEYYSLRRVLGS